MEPSLYPPDHIKGLASQLLTCVTSLYEIGMAPNIQTSLHVIVGRFHRTCRVLGDILGVCQ